MSFITERYNIDHCPNRGLSVIQCGWQKCDSNHHRGPMHYLHYSITFVLNGCGLYTTGGKTYSIKAGEGFIIRPNVSTYYIADKTEPWEYIFAIFHGPDSKALLRSAGLDESNLTFRYEPSESMRSRLFSMCEASKSSAAKGYDVIGEFMLCMSQLVRAHNASEGALANAPEDYVAASIAYMEKNYLYGVTVNSVAEYVGIERSYFYRLFKEKMHCSPSDWLIRYRLERAVEMMEQTQFSLTEIAYSVGFYDASHFSKAFTRLYKDSPNDYRKKHFSGTAAFHQLPDQPSLPVLTLCL